MKDTKDFSLHAEMNTVSALEGLYFATNTFNMVAGNDQKITDQDFEDQFKVVVEEMKEFQDGHTNKDLVETTDGIVDNFVVLFGYMQKMQNRYGIDFAKAMDLIAENNLSKYPTDEQVAIDTVQMYHDQGLETYYTFHPESNAYVIRDSKTNKIKKPVGFKSVDLSVCFPKVH